MEHHNSTLKLEKSFKDAVAELSSYHKQLDEHSAARERLERTVSELKRQLAVEQRKTKFVDAFKIKQKQWRAETQDLIISIQEECNSVFQSKISDLPKESSSLQVMTKNDQPTESAGTTTLSTGNDTSTYRPSPVPKTNTTTTLSTSFDILQSPVLVNKTLDETEAFVQSLLGDNFQT